MDQIYGVTLRWGLFLLSPRFLGDGGGIISAGEGDSIFESAP
jgi:hypothetical protein